MENKKKATLIHDIILIFSLLLASLILFLLIYFKNDSGSFAVVRVNDKVIGTYSLDKDGTYILNGGSNTLVIQDGLAYLIEATCPDKLCVKQGKIRKNGQCITCLPNKLTVTVTSNEDTVDFVL